MFQLDTRILIVDDMMTMRKFVKKALAEAGFTNLTEAADGDAAFPLLKEAAGKNERFGLVISDWNMPKMKGIDLLKGVREDPALRDTPFILLTAEAEAHQIQQAAALGVDSYVVKPFSAETLKEKIAQVHKKRAA